jgi:hypothetical protein
MKTVLLLLAFLLPASSGFSWGLKGHTIVSEAATHAVPYEMPAFFHDAYPGLVYLGYDPDRWRGAGESLDAISSQDHFLDYEFVEPLGTLPVSRYEMIELMNTSGLRRSLGIGLDEAGFVPWRVAELCDLLTRQWRLWRDSDHPIEKRQIEQNIIHLAGILGHFVADSANPHHATKEYNGWTAPNPNGYRTDCETHSRFESRFVTRHLSVDLVLPYMSPPMRRDDYFNEAVGFIRASNAEVEALYMLDRDGAFDGMGTDEGIEFAARRMALGSSWLRDLWWSAWLNGTADRGGSSR